MLPAKKMPERGGMGGDETGQDGEGVCVASKARRPGWRQARCRVAGCAGVPGLLVLDWAPYHDAAGCGGASRVKRGVMHDDTQLTLNSHVAPFSRCG